MPNLIYCDRPLKQKKILKALAVLDHEATKSPDSVWEWRVANLRLSDMWLIPLVWAATLRGSSNLVR